MSVNIPEEWKKSMDQLSFSAGIKDRMCQKLLFAKNRSVMMKKYSFRKTAAAIAVCTFAICGTVLGAGKLRTLYSWSNADYDFTSPKQAEKSAVFSGEFDIPDTLGSGFVFDGANTVHVSEEGGNKWKDLSIIYKDADSKKVFLNLSDARHEPEEESRKATSVRNINGIQVEYNFDEYLVIPEGFELDQATRNRAENDAHFFISEGSEEPETSYYRCVVFHKDGIRYSLGTTDTISEEALYNMAGQLTR